MATFLPSPHLEVQGIMCRTLHVDHMLCDMQSDMLRDIYRANFARHRDPTTLPPSLSSCQSYCPCKLAPPLYPSHCRPMTAPSPFVSSLPLRCSPAVSELQRAQGPHPHLPAAKGGAVRTRHRGQAEGELQGEGAAAQEENS